VKIKRGPCVCVGRAGVVGMTKREAWRAIIATLTGRIAANIAKLPTLLDKG